MTESDFLNLKNAMKGLGVHGNGLEVKEIPLDFILENIVDPRKKAPWDHTITERDIQLHLNKSSKEFIVAEIREHLASFYDPLDAGAVIDYPIEDAINVLKKAWRVKIIANWVESDDFLAPIHFCFSGFSESPFSDDEHAERLFAAILRFRENPSVLIKCTFGGEDRYIVSALGEFAQILLGESRYTSAVSLNEANAKRKKAEIEQEPLETDRSSSIPNWMSRSVHREDNGRFS